MVDLVGKVYHIGGNITLTVPELWAVKNLSPDPRVIIKLYSRPGSPVILVFFEPAPLQNSKETPLGGVKQRFSGENSQFSANISKYLGNGTRQTDGCCGTLIRSRRPMYPIDPCQFRCPWVTVKGKTQGVQFFRRMFIHTLVYTINTKAIEFGIVTHVHVRRDCKRSGTPPTQEAGPRHPQFWRYPYGHILWRTGRAKKVSPYTISCSYLICNNLHEWWMFILTSICQILFEMAIIIWMLLEIKCGNRKILSYFLARPVRPNSAW